jgi:hypothetical protein
MGMLISRSLWIAILCSLLTGAQARASCYSLEELDDENDDCSSNSKYVDAGIGCFLTFENKVKKEAGDTFTKMNASNKKFVMGSKNSQASGMAGTTANFKLSEAALDNLIKAGKATLGDLDSYSRNIYFPEEWDAPEELIGDGLEYLNSSPCYAEPRDMLSDMKKSTEDYIKELEAAKAAITAMKGVNTGNDAKIDNMAGQHMGQRKPASVKPAKGAALKPKKPTNGKSTITGVEEEKKKRSR